MINIMPKKGKKMSLLELKKLYNWSGGISCSRKLAFEFYKMEKKCENCFSKINIEVHHRDKNRNNNSKENLQILCKLCHLLLHKVGVKRKVFTKSWRDNIGKSVSGNKNGMFNKNHTSETKKIMRESKLGKNNPFYGKTQSEKNKKPQTGRSRAGD